MEMSNGVGNEQRARFSDDDSLALHQLRLLEWLANSGQKTTSEGKKQGSKSFDGKWVLTKGVKRYAWQEECIGIWLTKGIGTVKVVTGGGKTILALAIIEVVQNRLHTELRVVIIVPTIVLMHQWYDVLLEHGNIPPEQIGRLGGGNTDDFDGKRVLITVLASASKELPKLVKNAGVEKDLMLVADECHRTGAKEMSEVFKTERRWSLGLSATPERDEEVEYDESKMAAELGPIIFEFNLADAVREGLVPKFTINHYGLPMNVDERRKYDALSRSITDAMSELRNQRESQEGDFFAWARSVAKRNKGELGSTAMRFVSDTAKRRELLNHLQSRQEAVVQLIRQELVANKDARIILFHESIAEVMNLYVLLREQGFRVIAEHSELPGSIRETGLDLFRKGIAQIIVSAKSLIEGFNVPAVDVGIIVASSASVRQRIQSLGRVLRRHRGPHGEEKTSCMHVLYAANSSEDAIYGKVDWDDTTGVDRNRYFLWDIVGPPKLQEGPPKTPLPTETQIDPTTLVPGSKYPGQYEGIELSCDTKMNIQDSSGKYAADTAPLAEAVLQVKGSSGKFKVTPKRNYVLVRIPSDEDWETVFVTRLSEPLQFEQAQDGDLKTRAIEWQKTATVGDVYPFGLPVAESNVRFLQKSGGTLTKKVRGRELFSRVQNAEDTAKGADAAKLLTAIKGLMRTGKKISRIEINEAGHVCFREGGQLFFICVLEKGLEFPPEQK